MRAFLSALLVAFAGAASTLSWAGEEISIRVKEVLSRRELLIEAAPGVRLSAGDRLAVHSTGDESGEIMGYAEVLGEAEAPSQWKAKLLIHSENGLIRAGDFLVPSDFSKYDAGLVGRADLFSRGNRGHSARYKPLVYQGAIGDTAATLDRGEFLADMLTYIHYGVTDTLSVSTLALADYAVPNLAVKYRLLDSEWVAISGAAMGSLVRDEEGVHLFSSGLTAYFDVKSNSKFISHTAVTLSYSPYVGVDSEKAALISGLQSNIQSGYEYVFDNWDRLLLGPRYNFETQSIGGYIGYMFIWDHLHLSLNISTVNFTDFRIATDAYIPYVYLFWRF